MSRPLLDQVTVSTDALGLVVTAPAIDNADLGPAIRSAVLRAGAMRGQRSALVEIAEAPAGFTIRSTADLTLDELWRWLIQLQRELVCGQTGLDAALADRGLNAASVDGYHRRAA